MKKVTLEKFSEVWNWADTLEAVAKELECSKNRASSMAYHLRFLGVELKSFPKGRARGSKLKKEEAKVWA